MNYFNFFSLRYLVIAHYYFIGLINDPDWPIHVIFRYFNTVLALRIAPVPFYDNARGIFLKHVLIYFSVRDIHNGNANFRRIVNQVIAHHITDILRTCQTFTTINNTEVTAGDTIMFDHHIGAGAFHLNTGTAIVIRKRLRRWLANIAQIISGYKKSLQKLQSIP